jgi:uncharacterized lipoprotein YajG
MILKIANLCLKMTILLIAATLSCSCAKSAYIDVDYRLPPGSDTLDGRTVFVETRDLRSDPEIFNSRAKEKFEHFTGRFALSLQMADGQQKLVGAYTLPILFETALKQRLQKLGVTVNENSSADVPVFQINIHRFNIHLVGQKWLADISYGVNLTHTTQKVAREVVTGNAERLKVMGSGGAEKVVGEIFTEMINQLNIERLFQQAEL